MNKFDQQISRKSAAKKLNNLVILGCLTALTACGGGGGDGGIKPDDRSVVRPGDQVNQPDKVSLNVMVDGLAGSGLILQNNGENNLAISADGPSSFSNPIPDSGRYLVTVGAQPTGQICTVTNGEGSNITATPPTVHVKCSATAFNISGVVKGLDAGNQITLFNNSADPIAIVSGGQDYPFKFDTPVAFDSSYTVTVVQPNDQICSVENSTDSGITSHVNDVIVRCSTLSHTVSGYVKGLKADSQFTINNNSADPLLIKGEGKFTFPMPVAHEGSYTVTVGTQPVGQVCTVSHDRNAGIIADIKDVVVECKEKTYTIAGAVKGLNAGERVTLKNNNANPVTITSDTVNGAFKFTTPVVHNGKYAVTIGTQPAGQTCSLMNNTGAGNVVASNVSNVVVTCSTKVYAISGIISGLEEDNKVTFFNNNSDPLIVDDNGRFAFTVPVAYNGSYAVTVGTNPFLQKCDVTNGSGSGVSMDVSTVQVNCKLPVMKTIDDFDFNNGSSPYAGLVQDAEGNFYGTTGTGGQFGKGTIFRIIDGEIERLYSFGGGLGYDGIFPSSRLVLGADGNFYGTTRDGGKNNAHGTVFRITPAGDLSTLYSFSDSNKGAYPTAGLIQGNDGNFYGTTEFGGESKDFGTIFRLDPKSDPQTGLTILYSFEGAADGAQPAARLIQGSDDKLYGTTTFGGVNNEGTIFRITLQGELSSLYSFNGMEDGANPTSELAQGSDGKLYGTTEIGGKNNLGTIYVINPEGSLKTLFAFDGVDNGAYPNAGLMQGADGNFYGTTWQGGGDNQGTIFSITPKGVLTTLHTFPGSARSSAGLSLGNDGGLYGTTQYGGADNVGTIFRYGAL